MAAICWIPQPIHASGINELRKINLQPVEESEITDLHQKEQVVAVIFRGGEFSCTMMQQFPYLRVIAVHGVGTDGIDVDAATQNGIVILNTPGMNALSVAEHAIGLMFALSKQLIVADQAVRQGRYQQFRYQGGLRELHNARLGVVGFGASGRQTARLAHALGMRVQVLSRQPENVLHQFGCQKSFDLAALLQSSDIVSLHVPAVPETRYLIDQNALTMMKPSALLINTSRGALVDENALIDALNGGKIAGAGLDVFEQEPLPADSALLQTKNLVVSPHIAASTEQALINMAAAAVHGID